MKLSVREFIEAAIFFADYRCTHQISGKPCGGKLKQVWITTGDTEEDTIMNYIECSKCNTEYGLLIAFVPNEELQEKGG